MSAQMIELLILFAIAAFVLYRLKSVIGTRTGYEAPPDYLTRERDAAPSGPRPVPDEDDDEAMDELAPPAAQPALARMREVDPDFSLAEFLDGARGAYEMILMAYEAGDRETLKGLLDKDVYRAFDSVIAEREAAGLTVEARFIGVREVRVESAEFNTETGEGDLTLRIVGELITAVHDAEGRVVEGDPSEVRRQTDIWTFSRDMGSRDPNWLLTATGG